MADDLDEVLTAVGPRLRALRQQHDTTLADLSQATGISVSTLSRLESGQRRPNLELLLPLARAYGVPLDDLVGAPPTGDPRVHLRPIRRSGRTIIPLTRRAGGIQAVKQVIPARRPPEEPDLQVHEGYEWVYVLNGRLRLVLGQQDLILSPGEAAEFDTRVPHWFGSTNGEPAEFLCLFGRQGERAHLRVRPRASQDGPDTPDRPGGPDRPVGPEKLGQPSCSRNVTLSQYAAIRSMRPASTWKKKASGSVK